MTGLQPRFDWYQATFEAAGFEDERVPSSLALAVGARVVRGKGRNGYAAGWDLLVGEDLVAQVYGRSARLGEVHVVVPGGSCDLVVPPLRRLWPLHRVSRADSAVDFSADFLALDALAVAFAEEKGLSFRLFSDSEGGATRYLGSARSEVMVRVYKKSEQLRARHPDQADAVPAGIVRAEAVVRPGKRAAKEAAATLDALDFWGLSEWSSQFAARLLDLEPMRVPTHFRRSSDWSRALHFLGLQYRPALDRRAADVGLDVALAELLEAFGVR